ncbi:CHAT domain-containing protein [Streptomyces sp. CC224B]|uniref:CHAT domain-containing protein n=1 Tax=Streptomyces sp. CC224B TaxID=3044571 RepID=UPI0024A9DFEF|nr:CHAT domain-containing protein [Streptomyces sp. CC224B]
MDRLTDLLMTERRGVDPRAAGTGAARTGAGSAGTGAGSAGTDATRTGTDATRTGAGAARGPAPRRPAPGGAHATVREEEWCEVAAALAAGESKRARALLDGPLASDGLPYDHRTLARSLRAAALHIEHNWTPVAGTSFLPAGTSAALASATAGLEAAVAAVGDERLRRCAELAGSVLPAALGARTMLGHLARTRTAQQEARTHGADEPWVHADLAPDIALVLQSFDATGGTTAPPAYRAFLAADLRSRAADPARARALLAAARQRAAEDTEDTEDTTAGGPAYDGHAELLIGEWLLGAPDAAHRALAVPGGPAADPDAAAAHLTEAAAAYRRAGSRSGQAAAALRLAHAARLRGRTKECRAALAQALDLALRAGDGACAALVRVQTALDAVARGATADPAGAEAVRAWGSTVGSGSWVTGLRGIALEHATSWIGTGDLVRGRGALLLADRLSDDVGTAERADAWARLYRSAGHRRAALLLTDVAMAGLGARVRTGPAAEHFGDLLALVHAAQLLHHHALALGDPDLLTAAGLRLGHTLEAVRRLPDTDARLAGTLDLMAGDLAELPVWKALFAARRERAAGLPDEADRHAEEALREADRLGNHYAACSALVELRRLPEAHTRARRIDAAGLSALQATALWLRVGDPEKAATTVQDIGRHGPEPTDAWELPALHAELRLKLGDLDAAHRAAAQGVDAYERHRARLARDALRSASADSPVVAGLHHTAVLSCLPPEPCAGAPAATAFAWAERARSGFLDAVRALDATGYPGTRAAVRAWLAAGTRWSARYEEGLAEIRREAAAPGRAARGDARERLARIAAAEAELDAAEATVRRLAPTALTATRGADLPDAAAVAAALPPDTLLLTYHTCDEDLVAWAVTRDGVRAERRRLWAGEVTATARRFHGGCAHGDSDGPAAARELATWLLEPFAAELRSHPRVVVVPPPSLSLLPFHVLPWGGDTLGHGHVVSYLPAASLLTRARRWDTPWPRARALLVGDPDLAPGTGLPPLPGTGVEAASIARLLPGAQLLRGPDASRDRVLAAAPECEVLHLATHGQVDDLSPSRSRLALTGTDTLDMADLIGCARAPRLLVLSACNSGRGTATAGGDVLGLTRAAMITGAHGAVVSLWPVGDLTGCLVMTRMYERLTGDTATGGRATDGRATSGRATSSTATDATAADVPTALHHAQREVRKMTGVERQDLYAELAAAADAPPSAPGTRDSEPLAAPAAVAGAPRHWAPFIYVGV